MAVLILGFSSTHIFLCRLFSDLPANFSQFKSFCSRRMKAKFFSFFFLSLPRGSWTVPHYFELRFFFFHTVFFLPSQARSSFFMVSPKHISLWAFFPFLESLLFRRILFEIFLLRCVIRLFNLFPLSTAQRRPASFHPPPSLVDLLLCLLYLIIVNFFSLLGPLFLWWRVPFFFLTESRPSKAIFSPPGQPVISKGVFVSSGRVSQVHPLQRHFLCFFWDPFSFFDRRPLQEILLL